MYEGAVVARRARFVWIQSTTSTLRTEPVLSIRIQVIRALSQLCSA